MKRTKLKPFFIISCFIILFLTGCKNDPPPPHETIPNRNFIILLDLSDRILLENQIADDRQTISAIFQQFQQTVKQHYYVGSKDKLTILIAPQVNENNIRGILPKLQIDFESIPIKDRAKYFENNTVKYLQNVKTLYDNAIAGKSKKEDFQGSDIWRFFNEQIKDNQNNYLQTDSSFENYIFVITDGYFDFEDVANKINVNKKYNYSEPILNIARSRKTNWQSVFNEGYGLLPIDISMSNLRVLVLGCNPKINDQLELPIIKGIWSNWLKAMNISPNNEVHEKVSKSQTQILVDDFISKKKNNAKLVKVSVSQIDSNIPIEKELVKEKAIKPIIPESIPKEISKSPEEPQPKAITVKEHKIQQTEWQTRTKNIIPKSKKKIIKNEKSGPKWVEDQAK